MKLKIAMRSRHF